MLKNFDVKIDVFILYNLYAGYLKITEKWFCNFKTRVMDLFTVFSTFYKNKLEKIRRHHWEERLKINNIAKFKSDKS